MKEHLRKKRSDLDSNFSSLKAFFRLPCTTPIGRKAITAAKFLIATTLLLAILFFSSQITAQDEFSLGQSQEGNGNEFGIMTNVAVCTTITASGIYTLTANITTTTQKKCIIINVSNVVFEGQGFTIDGTDASSSFGIYVENRTSSLTNITIQNVSVTDYTNGIYINNTLSGAILNTTTRSNTNGLKIIDSTAINVTGNNALSNSYGVLARNISQVLFDLNNFTSNTNTGMDLWITANNNITNNNISKNSQWGIRLRNSNNTILDSNILNSNTNYGLDLSSSNYSTIKNNIANDGSIGFYIFSSYLGDREYCVV